ncbi:glycosyltransferase family protein [Anabaena sp. UHCC 0399]|uniref:glycosyltransferase family protein n=1 Tax=Anabaena sp. UHCC 0399 TaxID=3110238 RepID=UPI002B21D222|nr:glycosyltransferase family protein [Anabaena sp. UHCC 0399]MEA5565129.1 glycosyltransferase family protein [Anabaena sp. UHCC 0399]
MNNLLPHSGEITRTSASIVSSEASSLSSNTRKWRIALYSHDTMGLGHKRRNLLIAQTLGFSPLQTDILMISGIQDASNLPTPPGVDCLTLPALHKNIDGQYQARKLNLSLQEIITLRSQVILTTIKTFKPDIFIVDNVPRGAVRELDPTLDYLRREGKTHCILGLRDILDEPASVRRDWKRAANEEAIQTYYDQVWVYSDRNIYDLAKEYRFHPKTVAKFRYTGYLDQRSRLKHLNLDTVQSFKALNLPSERLVLCLVGGGQDGAMLAETFAHAELPPDMNGIILTGPFMPREIRQKLQNYAAQRHNLRVLEYLAEPTMLLHQAERVIAMGGYNTTCELLSFGKRSLILPRVKPRKEQLIRAERLKELGLIDFLHPDQLTSAALTNWLKLDIEPPPVRKFLDLKGLTRIPQFVNEILMSTHQASPQAKAS